MKAKKPKGGTAAKANQGEYKKNQPTGDRPVQAAREEPAVPPTNWVQLTPQDLLQSLTPEQRKVVCDLREAVTCPNNLTARLTPEQKLQREAYWAMKWPEYDARMRELHPTQESRFIPAIKAVHDFADEAEWFATNTPYPFKLQYHSPIVNLADVSSRYLRTLARRGNRAAIRALARLTVEMTETLTDLLMGYHGRSKENAEVMRSLATRLPYWPWLRFRHAAANNRVDFKFVAGLLDLGRDCPINATGSANWNLQTPINRFVWRCLRHFDEVHWIIRDSLSPRGKSDRWPEIVAAAEGAMHVLELISAGKFNISPDERPDDPIEQALEPYVFTDRDRVGMIYRDEIRIYKASYRLAPLTKANAREWGDVAIMPYIRRRFPDLRAVEELRGIEVGKTGRRYGPLRMKVIQALRQLAPKP